MLPCPMSNIWYQNFWFWLLPLWLASLVIRRAIIFLYKTFFWTSDWLFRDSFCSRYLSCGIVQEFVTRSARWATGLKMTGRYSEVEVFLFPSFFNVILRFYCNSICLYVAVFYTIALRASYFFCPIGIHSVASCYDRYSQGVWWLAVL